MEVVDPARGPFDTRGEFPIHWTQGDTPQRLPSIPVFENEQKTSPVKAGADLFRSSLGDVGRWDPLLRNLGILQLD